MARFLYGIFYFLLTPVFFMVFLILSRKNSGWRQGWLERLGWVAVPKVRNGIWLHAASVGEVQASMALVKKLQKNLPHIPLVVTTFTPTGAEQVLKNMPGVTHYYFPLDNAFSAYFFLKRIQPALVIMMERELWPNLLAQCEKQSVPVLLANARLSEKSFRSYQRFLPLVRPMLQRLTLVAVQNRADGERFLALGLPAERLEVTGSVKFDIELPAGVAVEGQTLRSQWGGERTVLALASSHEDEDERLLALYKNLAQHCPNLLLMLVPRHPERFDAVANAAHAQRLKVQRRSQGAPSADTQVYIADTLGEMLKVLSAADLVLMGGSLIPRGGHNPIEPAALGKPVLIGSYYFNFSEIVAGLEAAGALKIVPEQSAALAEILAELLQDREQRARMGQAGLEVVANNRGAVKALVQRCQELMSA